jgi:hypothetical protein
VTLNCQKCRVRQATRNLTNYNIETTNSWNLMDCRSLNCDSIFVYKLWVNSKLSILITTPNKYFAEFINFSLCKIRLLFCIWYTFFNFLYHGRWMFVWSSHRLNRKFIILRLVKKGGFFQKLWVFILSLNHFHKLRIFSRITLILSTILNFLL